MDPMRSTVNVHRLDKDVPVYENMHQYQSIRASCLFSYHQDYDIAKDLEEISGHFTKWQGSALMDRANNGDPDAILDLALRYLSGCGVRKQSSEGALYVLDAFVDPSCDRGRYIGDTAPRMMIAQAHSCAAEAYFLKFVASPSERADIQADERRFSRPVTLRLGVGQSPLGYFTLAAHHANESVNLGLVSPAVLVVGMKIRQIGDLLGADVAQAVKRGKRFRPLWRAVSRRHAEFYAEERKRQQKVDKKPNAYVCAAEGCKIRGEKKAALRSCSGRCPPDLKPHYCSPECQKKDWSRHKTICKPDSNGKAPKFSDEDKAKALQLFELGEPEEEEEEPIEEISTHENKDDSEESHRGPGRIIDVPAPGAPGGSIQITSNTIEPEFMRSFRDFLSKMAI